MKLEDQISSSIKQAIRDDTRESENSADMTASCEDFKCQLVEYGKPPSLS